MKESSSELKTNQLDSVQTSLICLIESEAEEMLKSFTSDIRLHRNE